jgi:hypothetical protein
MSEGIVAEWFQRAVAAAEEGESGFVVTLESRRDANKWIQLTWDAINVAYPLATDPGAELARRGFELPEYVELSSWEAGKFATFAHAAEPLPELVAFVERYSREVLGVDPSEEAFAVSTFE